MSCAFPLMWNHFSLLFSQTTVKLVCIASRTGQRDKCFGAIILNKLQSIIYHVITIRPQLKPFIVSSYILYLRTDSQPQCIPSKLLFLRGL